MKHQQYLIDLGEYFNKFRIKEIDEDTNFWMIRTKSGYFYNEFIQDNFVALGWNYIDSKTDFGSQSIEVLKSDIERRYGEKRPMGPINKCKRFINEIKEGDYVMIPNSGSSEIAIAIVGEYFEEDIDFLKEIRIIQKIDNRESEINSIKCPYKKRRKITVLLRVKAEKIGFKLLRAISNYHGLSDMNEYAEDILNCLYDSYSYREDIMFSINIDKNNPVKPRELSRLMYGITEFFSSIADEDDISVTINLNSPGKATVKYKKGFNKLKKKVFPLVALYVAVTGGSVCGFEFPGLIGVIKEVRLMGIEEKKAEAELESQQLDNYMKALEVIDKVEEEGIDGDNILNNLELLEELKEPLNLKSSEEFATSNIQK